MSKRLVTLDSQLPNLPNETIYCKNCVVSNQRPRTIFDKNGVCSACNWSWEKDHTVDWEQRINELAELCDKYRSKDGSFDILVPGSGGKDSAFVAHQLKERWGMHPLCVTWAPFDWTPMGWRNLVNFSKAGFNNIIAQPNGVLHRKLARCAFEALGDAFQPFVYGQKSFAFHTAQKYGIKLIMYGENGELEYGGSIKYKNRPKEDPSEWEKFYFKGMHVDKLIEYGIEKNIILPEEANTEALSWYKPLHPDEIAQDQIEMHWYSYYSKWTPQENFYYVAKYTGFETSDEGRMECTYTKYAGIDDKADAFHFYLGYMKFGMNRASRDAMQDIRRHHLTRDEGVALVHKYDHEFPSRYFKWFLDYIQISEELFWAYMDFYREQSKVWEKQYGQWQLKHIVT